MKDILGEDLPKFTKDDLKSSKNGLDFIGINQYTSRYAKDCLHTACEPGQGGSRAEGFVYSNALKTGLPLGERVCRPSAQPIQNKTYFQKHFEVFSGNDADRSKLV